MLQGSLSFSGRGLDEDDARVAVVVALAAWMDTPKNNVELTGISRGRRMAEDVFLSSPNSPISLTQLGADIAPRRLSAWSAWDVDYKVSVPSAQAVTLIPAVEELNSSPAPLLVALEEAFIAQGKEPNELLLAIRSVSRPTLIAVTGPPVDSCGNDFCPVGMVHRSTADLQMCKISFNCSQAEALCCEEVQRPTLGPPEVAMAGSYMFVMCVTFIISICVICACCLERFLVNPVLFRMLPRCVRARCGCCLSTHDDAKGANPKHHGDDHPSWLEYGRATNQLSLQDPELELNVIELLLNDLQGEWRLYDQDQMMAGIVRICENGKTYYDEANWPTQDLFAQPGGIVRKDGWCIDMQRSDTDSLEWMKPGESGITWKRCKGISAFAIGDWVEWTAATSREPQVEQGAIGQVVGFTDDRVRVNFEGKQSPHSPGAARTSPKGQNARDCKPSALAVVETARREEEDAEPPRALPSLAHCVEFKRLGLFADTVGKENTGLATENDRLRRELGSKVDKLSTDNTNLGRENTRLRQQLDFAENMQRELTNSLIASKDNTALALDNQKLGGQLAHADELHKELTSLSKANERLRDQLQDLPKDPYAHGPTTPQSGHYQPNNGSGARGSVVGLDRASPTGGYASRPMNPQGRGIPPPPPSGSSPSSMRWQASPHTRNGNWDFYAADDDDDDDDSDDDNLAI